MNKPLTRAVQAALSACALVLASAAHADSTLTSVTEFDVLTGSSTGMFGIGGARATLFDVSLDGTHTWAFCIDPTTIMGSGAHSYSSGPFTPSASVQRLYENFYGGVSATNAAYNGAFQVALWELNNDDGDLATGNLHFTASALGANTGFHAQVGTMISTAQGDTPLSDLYAYNVLTGAQAGTQTLLSVSALPVPEASEWAMLLAGLGIVGLVRRRT